MKTKYSIEKISIKKKLYYLLNKGKGFTAPSLIDLNLFQLYHVIIVYYIHI